MARQTLKGKGRMQTGEDGDLFPTLTYKHLHSNLGAHNPLRVIALCDSDAFYASCEQVRLNVDPQQPLVVQQWTNLIAVNYPARKFGITRHESAVEAKKKCPNLMAVHVATYREGDAEPRYWDDPSPLTHKVSLDHYRRESARVFKLFQDTLPPGGEIEKASIDEVFIDYTIPVKTMMLERYPELQLPSGPFDLDTPLPPPPAHIDWSVLETNVVPVQSPPVKDEARSTPDEDRPRSPGAIDGALASGSSSPEPPEPPAPEPEPGSDASPTWHDVALSIGAELMRAIRVKTHQELGYTLSAGIARNKMLAKLSASYRKPMAQSVLRNAAIPGYLGPMPFQKIRFLGGKLGDVMAAKFEATTVAELKEISLEDMQSRCGEESIWVWNVLRGIDYSEVKERTALKSMAASKNVRPAITTFEQARHWLSVLAAELAVRLTDARQINPTVWPRTVILHARQASSAPRSKQIAFPFVRAFSAATILAPGERLWKMLFPGSGEINPGVINVMLGFGGLESLETGQRGIEGFLGAKAKKPESSGPQKPHSKPESSGLQKPSSKKLDSKRRTVSPGIAKPKNMRDFFGASTKRKTVEVIDDSDSDVVEISPPPRAKRTNTGSSEQTAGSSRSTTPTRKSSGDKKKQKGGIANFFEPARTSGKPRK